MTTTRRVTTQKSSVLFSEVCRHIICVFVKSDKINGNFTFFLILICWVLYRCRECPRYRPGVAQRVDRGIALLFHDRGTRRGWVVSSTPRPHFIPGKDRVPIVQSGPQGQSGRAKNLVPTVQPGSSVAIPTELPGPLSIDVLENFRI